MKYIGNDLAKEMKDLYIKNYSTPKKEIIFSVGPEHLWTLVSAGSQNQASWIPRDGLMSDCLPISSLQSVLVYSGLEQIRPTWTRSPGEGGRDIKAPGGT